MKRLLFFVCLMICCLSGFAQQNNNEVDSVYKTLKSSKAAIDSYSEKNPQRVLVYTKLPGKTTLKKLGDNEDWPELRDYDYNVVRGASGKIVKVVQMPFVPSGDWFIAFSYYFDDNGNIFAFERMINGFNNDVKGGIIYEKQIKYYTSPFKLVKTVYSLKRKDGKPLKNRMNLDGVRPEYKIYQGIASCRKAFNLPANL
ncbi:hypothetical protein D0C36_16605 [Mucilaginibacter conchicola]|uniref:Uncharacterized protein n=1 Tax=Mucilaginibacter conchicola TaxID=2303333 RepID=A0A372NUX1_9SPHI|nr:hypothetical protein [Mucilaginibacter conchicola]RFZ93005.1 hypothetical protein D0C36_16605 [Mucilaginibacter conchicola]